MPIFPQTLRALRYRLFYSFLLNRKPGLLTLGNTQGGCSWTFSPKGFDQRNVVYGGGVGGDISFEHELVKRFGCHIVLFDPSPTGKRTMSLPENQIPQFHYLPLGLAAHTGTLALSSPLNAEGDWWRGGNQGRPVLEVPCIDLASLMQKNGHVVIDLLKLDIEGSEYEVLDDVLARRLPVRQICVEFHHGILPGVRRSQTIRTIFKLRAAGYQLIHHSEANHTFLQKKPA